MTPAEKSKSAREFATVASLRSYAFMCNIS